MNAEIKRKWVEALRSGEYRQGKGRLRTRDDAYCCLGLLCEIDERVSWKGITSAVFVGSEGALFLPPLFAHDVGINSGHMSHLVRMNDCGDTFSEIADYIEKNL